MDPLIELLHRVNPADHSLDGLPLSWIVGGLGLVLLSGFVLAATGRSWRRWTYAASMTFGVWWSGVVFGRSSPGGGSRILALVVLAILLLGPGVLAFRAALERRPKQPVS